MYLDAYRKLREQLLLGNRMDYPAERLRALANDSAQLKAELAQWETKYATALTRLTREVHEVLLALALTRTTVPQAHVAAQLAIKKQRDNMPELAWLLDATPVLYAPFNTPLGDPVDFIHTMRIIWIAINRHDLLEKIHAGAIRATTPANEMTPANVRWRTREWTAREFKHLHRLGRYVDGLDRDIEEAGPRVARSNAITRSCHELHRDVRTFARGIPDMRALIEIPQTPEEFQKMVQGFSSALPL